MKWLKIIFLTKKYKINSNDVLATTRDLKSTTITSLGYRSQLPWKPPGNTPITICVARYLTKWLCFRGEEIFNWRIRIKHVSASKHAYRKRHFANLVETFSLMYREGYYAQLCQSLRLIAHAFLTAMLIKIVILKEIYSLRIKKYGQRPKWSSAKRVFEKCVVKITVKTLMLIDLWPWVLTCRHLIRYKSTVQTLCLQQNKFGFWSYYKLLKNEGSLLKLHTVYFIYTGVDKISTKCGQNWSFCALRLLPIILYTNFKQNLSRNEQIKAFYVILTKFA